MATYSDFVLDDYKRPILGANVEAYASDGTTLLDATVTDALGAFTVEAPDQLAILSVSYGGLSERSSIIIGIPTGFAGPPGPAANTYSSYAALLASDPTRRSAYLVGDTDANPHPDGPYTNPTATANGWIPQSAAGIIIQQQGTGATRARLDAAVRQVGIVPAEFGIVADGSDETTRLQAAVDAAATYGVPLLLGGGAIGISAPIVLTDRNTTMRGVIGKTSILALNAMDRMWDMRNTSAFGQAEGSWSPHDITNLTIDCDHKAAIGVDFKETHQLTVQSLRVLGATGSGIQELDTWETTFINVGAHDCRIGWNCLGAQNSTVRLKCIITGCTDTFLRIRGDGTFSGSTEAFYWNGSIQFGTGVGIDVGKNCNVTIRDSYLFEGIERGILNSGGFVTVDGGNVYFGYVDGYPAQTSSTQSYVQKTLRDPSGIVGDTLFRRLFMNGQVTPGINPVLGRYTAAEIAAGLGSFRAEDIVFNGPTASNRPIAGDFLGGYPSGANLVPRYGSQWGAIASAGAAVSNEVLADGITRKITCTTAGGYMALTTPLMSRQYTINKPLYQLYVFETNCPVAVQVAGGSEGQNPAAFITGSLDPADATNGFAGIVSFLLVTSNIGADAYTTVNFTRAGAPKVGDFIALRHASIADYAFIKANNGNLANIRKL